MNLGAKRRYDSKCTYMLSIHAHQVKDFVAKDDLDNIRDRILGRIPGVLLLGKYEVSPKYYQLHWHGIIQFHRPVHYRKENMTSIDGFRVFWKRCFDIKGAVSYCNKDSKNADEQQQILTENYYRHNYGFTNDTPPKVAVSFN